MFNRRWLIASALFFSLNVLAESPWLSADFLAIYHYKKSWWRNSWTSAIQNEKFFFTKDGPKDPHGEWLAAQEVFRSTKGEFGIQRQPAACVFPARRRVIEKLSGEIFPDVKCSDLDQWLERLNAQSAHLIFVGAFAGNPASLLGHIFVRLSPRPIERRSDGQIDSEQDLLSYSAGFLANPDPQDSRPAVIAKGLTGAYPGYFEIEPHYMKVGLYNNSESRDLWDWPLAFSAEEVRFMALALYERLFNSQMKYYFIDENCAYWLAALFDAVRPSLRLTEQLPLVVLPMDLLRGVERQGLLADEAKFRPSEGRQIDWKFDQLTGGQKTRLEAILASASEVAVERDPQVLDLAADIWKLRTYQSRVQLSAKDTENMRLTLGQLAESRKVVNYRAESEDIRQKSRLQTPATAHASRSMAIDNERVTFLLGAHASWQPHQGYDHVDNIEYLGLKWNRPERDDQSLELILANVRSIENFGFPDYRWSWNVDFRWRERCALCQDRPGLDNAALAGLAHVAGHFKFFALAGARVALWRTHSWQGEWGPDFRLGVEYLRDAHNLVLDGEWHDSSWGGWLQTQIIYGWRWRRDLSIYSRLDLEKFSSLNRDPRLAFGGGWFF